MYRQRETIIATNTLFVSLIGISFNTLWKITGDKGERIRRGIQLIQYPILCSYSNATRYPLTKDVLFLSPYFEILRVSSHRGKIPSLKIVRQIYICRYILHTLYVEKLRESWRKGKRECVPADRWVFPLTINEDRHFSNLTDSSRILSNYRPAIRREYSPRFATGPYSQIPFPG